MERPGDLRATLGSRGFRRLLGIRLVSQFSDGLFQAGLAGNVLFNPERKPDALAVATGFAILLLPYSLIGPYVGVFLDRWYRRTVLYLANLLRAVLVLPVALLVWLDTGGLALAPLALVVIAVNRFFLAGLSAAMPHVVRAERLVTANAIASTFGTLLYSVGLGAVGLAGGLNLIRPGAHGYAAEAVLGAVGYACSALLARVSFVRDGLGPEDTRRRAGATVTALLEVGRGMVAGLRHLAHRPPAGTAMTAQAAHRILYGVLAMTTLVLYRRYFYPDDAAAALAGLALIVAAGGGGSLLAAFITPPVTRVVGPGPWLTGLYAGVGVIILAAGPLFRPLALVTAVFLINIASQGIKIVVDTILQQHCADLYRGRVFSVNDTAFNASFVLGLYLAASLLPTNGRSLAVVITVGAGYELIALWYGLSARRGHQADPAAVPLTVTR